MLGAASGASRRLILGLVAVALVAGCGSSNPSSTPDGGSVVATPNESPVESGIPASASPSSAASAEPAPSASASDAGPPTVAQFWQMAVRALSRSGRLRVVGVGTSPVELRFEPKASGTVVEGDLTSACIAGVSYVITGLRASTIPGKWACGGSALISGFRRSGQPIATWNTRLPVDTDITEEVTVLAHDRLQWEYTGTSALLGGTVRTSVILDVATGRLVSGQRADPKANTRYTFSYTSIFAPIALP